MSEKLTEQQIKEKLEKEYPELYHSDSKPKIKQKFISKDNEGMIKVIGENKIIRRLKIDNPELYQKYKSEGLFDIPKEVDLPRLMCQQLQNMMGAVCVERAGIDVYWMWRVVILISSHIEKKVGREWLRIRFNQYGGDYDKTMDKISKHAKLFQTLKITYDCIADKTFRTKLKSGTVDSDLNKSFRKNLSKIPLYLPELGQLYSFLINSTSAKTLDISSHAISQNWENVGIHMKKIQKKSAVSESPISS